MRRPTPETSILLSPPAAGPRRLGVARLAALLTLVALLAPIIWASAADAGPGEGDLVSLINAERSTRGLEPLAVDGRLVEHARSHSASMATAGSVFHSLDLASAVSGWERLGENVGRGSTAAVVHEAFMASPGHRDHVLGDFTHVGVGTQADEGGMLYVTVAFMAASGAEPPSSTTTIAAAAPDTASASPVDAGSSPPTTLRETTSPVTVRAADISGPESIQPSAGAIAERLEWHPTEPFLR